jgi:hypothetical protein
MFEKLRRDLVQIVNHSGQNSIEDLVALAASAATGLTFRRAQPGPQDGADASADAVKIEVKRYQKGSLRRRELLGEILEASNNDKDPTEVWVLVTTLEIPSQLKADLLSGGQRVGSHVAFVDWAPQSMPTLLVLLASVPEVTLDWLASNAPSLVREFEEAFRKLRGAEAAFFECSKTLLDDIVPVYASLASAKKALQETYLRAFADPTMARRLFGQELAPLRSDRPLVERRAMLQEVDKKLHHLGAKQFFVILGDEGVGKSWIAAEYWRRFAQDHLLLILPSYEFSDAQQHGGATGRLDQALRTGAGFGGNPKDSPFAPMIDRWSRAKDPRRKLLVVLDGLNERPSAPWTRIIDDLISVLEMIGGRLIVTCRPRFWHREIANRMEFASYEELEIRGFDDDEFAEAMRLLGRSPGEFSPELRGDLANPRVFSLAVDLLGSLSGGGIVTKERVLWEYWRRRSVERVSVELNDFDFRDLLIRHAETAWNAIKDHSRAPARFRYPTEADARAIAERASEKILADLHDVATGRFFQPATDIDGRYFTFVPDKLWYALGLRLAYMAAGFIDENKDAAPLREQTAALIEPFSEMDVATDIVAAAFAVTALYPSMRRHLAPLFLGELIDLRNRQNDLALRLRNHVLAYVNEAPEAYLEVAERNEDPLVIEALRRVIVKNGTGRPVIIAAVGDWLRHESVLSRLHHETSRTGDAGNGTSSANLFLLAMHIISGISRLALPGLIAAAPEDRAREDLNLARWFFALDQTGDPPNLFTRCLPEADPPEPNMDHIYPLASNEPLQCVVDQWLKRPGNETALHAVDHDRSLFERRWNLSLAPSLLAWVPTGANHALAAVHNAMVSNSDPGEVLLQLVEARVLSIPPEHRIKFLLQFTRPVDAGVSSLPSEPALPLGVGIGRRYLSAALQEAGWPELDLEHAEILCFSLDFLRRVSDLDIDSECACALASIISDANSPASVRQCAIDLALQLRERVIARRLVDSDWLPIEEQQLDTSLHGSDLIAMTLHEVGTYGKVRDRLATNALATAIETVHDDDLMDVVDDLDRLLGERLISADSYGEEGAVYIRVLTQRASERLGRATPAKLAAWCERLRSHFERTPDDKELGDFAWSLLPGCAIADIELAANYLAFLISWHVEATGHDSLQVTVPHLWIGRAMRMPRSPSIDRELERLIEGAPDDDTLLLIVDAALAGDRRSWLEEFIRRDVVCPKVARAARARYLAALWGLKVDPVSGRGSALLDAVERKAVHIETQRDRLNSALVAWQQAVTERARFAAEVDLFDSIGRYFVEIPPAPGHGDLGVLLAARIARALAEGPDGVNASLFGLALPPAWMVLANVPPRLHVPSMETAHNVGV